jgi:Uma2 family endonuclease
MALPRRDALHHTYRDYLGWPEDVRYELVDGAAYLMSPAPSLLHQRIVVELSYQIRGQLEGKPCEVLVAPLDVRLPIGEEVDEDTDTVVQPDVLIVCDKAKLDERGVRGAPDWLLEILSPKTAEHDLTVKLPAYERAGVGEVWFIHPTDRMLVIFLLEAGAYGRPRLLPLRGQTLLTVVPGITIDWDRMTLAT